MLLLPDSHTWRARSCADEDCIQASPWPEALQPEGLPFTYEDAAPPTPQSPQAPGGINSGYTITQRSTYFLAGQAVAMRQVIPGESNNLLHLHSDHLGSNSVMSYSSNGGMVGGSRTRYLPFGAYRTAPSHLQPRGLPYTDRGFTGQKHNDDVGLIYYNARYYLPGVGRFVSADSIVPDATNPQAFNRYSYVFNNPVFFNDPSGHCGADTTYATGYLPAPPGEENPTYTYTVKDIDKYSQCDLLRTLLHDVYGWTIQGEWYLADVQTLLNAANALETWFARGGAYDPTAMVKRVFSGTIFQYASDLSPFRFGGFHHVFENRVVMLAGFALSSVIHELGHVLDNSRSSISRPGGAVTWGGGLSDEFADYAGMEGYTGCLIRFWCHEKYTGVAESLWDDGQNGYYLNGSPEDFAQAFKFSVLWPSSLRDRSSSRYLFFNVLRVSIIDTFEFHS